MTDKEMKGLKIPKKQSEAVNLRMDNITKWP
jgi:hypothetical protein